MKNFFKERISVGPRLTVQVPSLTILLQSVQKLRPVVRAYMPIAWQYAFSEWIYSTVKGPNVWWGRRKNGTPRGWLGVILHRLYWLTNPRGDESRVRINKSEGA